MNIIQRIFTNILAVLMLFACTSGVFAAEADANTAGVAGNAVSYSIDGTASYLGSSQEVDNATAAFMYEYSSGTLMYAWNPDLRIAPSSLVKILTAYLAVEKGDLDAVVTVDSETLSEVPLDAVSVDLVAGEELTLYDLLMCMLVGSGNDAAAVIASHISGSQEAFVAEMNSFAQSLGCLDTQFTNTHGIHEDEQYSTVRDIARILSKAMENESFRALFGTVDYDVPATNLSEARNLSSNNFLMNDSGMDIYYDDRITGGRTGIASDGTRCLAATAEENGLQVLCVITGAESTVDDTGNTTVYGSFQEVSQLFDMVFDGYKKECILYPEQAVKQIPVPNGRNDLVLGVQSAVSVILPLDTDAADLQLQYHQPDTVQAPITRGDMVFPVEVWCGGICLAEVDMYAMNDVASVYEHDEGASGDDGTASVAGTAVLICLSVVLVLGLCVAGVYLWRKFGKKIRNLRYQRNRRRSR